MRYIVDTDGHVKQVSFGADILCDNATCTEYTGDVPKEYKTLEDWYLSEAEKLYRWKIVEGNLTLDSTAVAPCDIKTKFRGLAASARGVDSSLSLAAGAVTPVRLGAWISRTDEAFDFSSDGGIVCPYDGVITVSGSVYVPAGSYNVSGGCYLRKGTTEIASQYIDGTMGGVSAGPIILPVSAGDIVYLCARRSTAGTCGPSNAATHLSVFYAFYELTEDTAAGV